MTRFLELQSWKQSNTRIINEMPERVNYNIAKWLSHGLAHTLSKTTINCAAEIIDETTDRYNNRMRIVKFNLDGYSEPFLYYHCVCPSTGREYYVETKQTNCQSAKAMSFGKETLTFDLEF